MLLPFSTDRGAAGRCAPIRCLAARGAAPHHAEPYERCLQSAQRFRPSGAIVNRRRREELMLGPLAMKAVRRFGFIIAAMLVISWGQNPSGRVGVWGCRGGPETPLKIG